MAFFNACSFYGNDKTVASTSDFEYDIYGNAGSRIAMNNCAFKAADSKISKNGSLIARRSDRDCQHHHLGFFLHK